MFMATQTVFMPLKVPARVHTEGARTRDVVTSEQVAGFCPFKPHKNCRTAVSGGKSRMKRSEHGLFCKLEESYVKPVWGPISAQAEFGGGQYQQTIYL